MELSIIIINFRSANFVREAVRSIYENPLEGQFEIIVVDSASFDGCGAMLEADFPEVVFIQSDENLGFARANNLGAERARGSKLLFLNPDTEVRAGALAELVRCLDSKPEAGIVGARLLNSDGTLQTSCIQSFPTLLNQLLVSECLNRRFPKARLWGMAPLFEDGPGPFPAEAISGACMLLRREVFESLGGFSPDYFMYSEDTDLCFKARRNGWINYYVPKAVIVHHGGGSSRTRENHFANVMMVEARARFFRKFYGPGYALAYRASTAAAAFARLTLLIAATGVSRVVPRRGMAPVLRVGKWAAILRWSLGLERSVRPSR
jgi:N-acetylglucosaminyl-diphospho-decaprenol L-rhamnosyltransferase